jgi:hypothetical protein
MNESFFKFQEEIGQNQKTLLLFALRRHIVLKILKLDGRMNGVVNVTLVMVIVKVLVLV